MDEENKQILSAMLDELRAMRDQGAILGASRMPSSSGTPNENTIKYFNRLGDTAEDVDKELEELGYSSRGLTRAQIDQLKAAHEYEKKLKTQAEALKAGTEAVKDFGKELLSQKAGFEKYGKSVEGFTGAIGQLLSTFGPFGKAVGATVAVVGKLSSVYMEQADRVLKANDQLAKFGTAGSFTSKELLQMAHGANLTSKNLDLFTKPIASMGTNMMLLGKNTGDSVKAFADLAKISYQQREEYQRLGVSQEELLQTQADYVALQSMAGRNLKAEMKDRAALQRASLEYQDTLLELATLTGQDVESIKKKQQEASRAVEWQISQIQLENRARKLEAEGRTEEAKKLRDEAKARQQALDRISALGNETVTKGARSFLATGTISGEEAQALTRMGLMEDLKELRKQIQSGADVQQATAKFQDAYNKKFGATIDNVGFAAQISKDVARQFGISEGALEKYNQQRDTNFKELSKAEKDRIEAAKKAGKDPAQDARAAMTTYEQKFGKFIDNLVAEANPLISGFNKTTIAATIAAGALGALAFAAGKAVTKGLASRGKEAIDAAREAARGRTGGGLPGTGGTVPPSGGRPPIPPAPLPGGRPPIPPAPLPGGPKVPPVPSIPGAKTPPIPSKAPLPSGAAGAGPGKAAQGVENLIGALGKGAGTALAGAAKGLEAFANPKVVLGAAGLGAAITAIGAGIAGATWLMGKALPTFAKGMEPFEKLDGDKLSKTGKGIAALGAGLAVFSVGGIASGVGSVLGGLSEGIASLFGAKTPFQKLEEFSRLNIDADKVKSNAEALVAFNKAMAGAGAAGAVSGLGHAISSLSEALGSFFKVKPPTEKLVEFASLKIDGQKVSENAKAFMAFSEAVASYKGGSAAGVASDIMESITSFFGVDNENAFKKFVSFSKLDIKDPEKIQKTAKAFVEFSDALAAYKGGSAAGSASNIMESVTAFFGVDNEAAFKKFANFSKLDIKEPERVEKIARAFVAFGNAMAQFKGGGEFKNIADNIGSGLNKLFGGTAIIEKFVDFSKLQVDPEKTGKLAEAFSKYAQGIGLMKGTVTSIAVQAPTPQAPPQPPVAKVTSQPADKSPVAAGAVVKTADATKSKEPSKAQPYGGYSMTVGETRNEKGQLLLALLSGGIPVWGPPGTTAKQLEQGKAQLKDQMAGSLAKTPAPGSDNKGTKSYAYSETTTFDAGLFREKDPENHAKYIARANQLQREKLAALEKDTNIRPGTSEARMARTKAKFDAENEAQSEYFDAAQKVGAATKKVQGTPPPAAPANINVKLESGSNKGSNLSPFTLQRGIAPEPSESSENPYGNLLQASDELADTFVRMSKLIDNSAKELTQLSDTFGRLDTNLKQNLTKSIPTEFGDAMGSLAKSIPVRVDQSMEELDEAMGESFGGAAKVRDSLKAGIADAARLRRELRGEEEPSGIGAAPAAPAAPAPVAPPSVAPPVQAAPPSRPPEVKQEAKQNLADLKSVLMAKGEKDENYLNAVLANVMKESGGISKEENLDYSKTSNTRIREVFGSRAAGMSDQQLNQIKSSKESMGEFMYGSGTEIGRRMGNTEAGDGWKYRGRGYIQLTGKSNYAAASRAIFGDDRLVKDPDLVNNPKIAAEVTAWYMQKTKSSMMKTLGTGEGPMSRDQANQLATSQVAGKAIRRGETGYLASTLSKVDQYSTQVAGIQPSSGGGGTSVASAGSSGSDGGFMSKVAGFFGFGSNKDAKPTAGSHSDGGDTRPTTTADASAALTSAKDAKNPKDQVDKAGLKVRPTGDVYQGGTLTDATLAAARQAQDQIPNFGMFTGLNDMYHQQKHPRSKHATGQGVDFTLAKMPTIDEAKEIKSMLQKIPGVSLVMNEYYRPPHGDMNQHTTGPHFHFQTSAAEGAVIDGPEAGYPVDLTAHGREVIAPLQANSILEMLASTPAKQNNIEPITPAVNTPSSDNDALRGMLSMQEEMVSILSTKMDLMIDQLSKSNYTQDKLLQVSRV